MFNLLVRYGPDGWSVNPVEFDKNRVAIEYTVDEISERYKSLNADAIGELKTFTSLFVTENEASESRIGRVSEIEVSQSTVKVHFEFDPIFPLLPKGAIEAISKEIGLGKFELYRTHWAIKDEPILEILSTHGYITSEQMAESQKVALLVNPEPATIQTQIGEFNKKQVFIVHGHDDIAKYEMASFVKELNLEPIILHQQASSGRTIIEKIEHYSNVGFAVVLYTPCDVGAKVGELSASYRARQNVVFEHGYLIGKLGRSRVAAVVKGSIETPNDISGVVYIEFDTKEQWKSILRQELKAVGYKV